MARQGNDQAAGALYRLHQIRPVIDRTFGFNQVPEAYAYLESAQHLGKVVIDTTVPLL